MKNIIKSSTLLAAIVGIVMAFAFKAPEPKNMESTWFKYIGDENGGAETNPENYAETSVSSCGIGSYLCGILAEEEGDSGRPTQAGVDEPEEVANQLAPEN